MGCGASTSAVSVTPAPVNEVTGGPAEYGSKAKSAGKAPREAKSAEEASTEAFGSVEIKLCVGGHQTDLLELIRENVLGCDALSWTPFGKRRIVYADYTASGRLLGFFEDYLRDVVYKLYANTHTETSATGFQTTTLREEARLIIANALNAPMDEYATLFVGTGCTGAIDKLGRVLGIMLPEYAATKWNLLDHIPEDERPVVFHGPFEHHSNELWWRESIATVVAIDEDASGRPSLEMLERELERYSGRTMKIGSFSAGSNVTGIRADTRALSELLHSHGALAFFDFAGIGAYCKIDMCPEPSISGADASIDAVYMSPHKFIGGPGASGLLVARRSLFESNKVPTCPGGGTVAFVSTDGRDYQDVAEAKEDGGTPGILQAIRCGLAFQLKERVGCDTIMAAEQAHGKAALLAWNAHPSIVLMGSDRGGYFDFENRVSIISFNILAPTDIEPSAASREFFSKYGGGRMLHPHFVVAVLNDVYGIQARSGCSCAGSYSHRLFGLAELGNPASAMARKVALEHGEHAVKPGWARVNFNFFISNEEAEFIRESILQIATDGWRLLPLYQMNPKSGQYTHRTFKRLDALRSLSELTIAPNVCQYRAPCRESTPADFAKVLAEARELYDRSSSRLSLSTFGGADYEPEPSAALLAAEWWCPASAATALMRKLTSIPP